MDKISFFHFLILGLCGLSLATTGSTQRNGYHSSPCSTENLIKGHLFHPYPTDRTKFIQCTAWGKAFLRRCPTTEIWNPQLVTCVPAHVAPVIQYMAGRRQTSQSQNMPSSSINIRSDYAPPAVVRAAPQRSQTQRKTWTPTQLGPQAQLQPQQNNVQPPQPQPLPSQARKSTYKSHQPMPQQPVPQQPVPQQPVPAKKSDPNPCSHPKLRYLAHPQDPQRYVECISGRPYERQCQGSQVWVQPIRQCVQLNEKPESQSKTHNPCQGAAEQFHPFPSNPHEYIECQAWYKATVRSCNQNELWVQDMQQCVPMDHLYPPVQGKIAPVAPQPEDVKKSGICNDTAKSFYHPYPHDVYRYIQCDEFGYLYIRKCGPNKVWDKYRTTCVGRMNETETSKLDSTNNLTPEVTSTDNPCPEGSTYDAPTHTCIFVVETGPSEPSLNQGQFADPCPDGYRWEASMGLCMASGIPHPVDSKEIEYGFATPNCAAGFQWNGDTQMCEPQRTSAVEEDPGRASYYYNFKIEVDIPISDFDSEEDIPAPPQPIPYTGDNPCGSSDVFYFEYAADNTYFIQCDQMGKAYLQPCGFNMVWSQQVMTCVPNMQVPISNTNTNVNTNSVAMSGAAREAEPSQPASELNNVSKPNPCSDTDSTHFHQENAGDDRYFIMCVQNTPYALPCPDGARWDNVVQACKWPKKYN